jgi:D-proline reductase (dithiol) PrdB
MGDLGEFNLGVRLFLKAYRWRRIDPVPWTPIRKPLCECRVALVSTAGLSLPEQPPFDSTVRGGDFSYREIPHDTDLAVLRDDHRSESFDHSGIHRDPNLALPADRLRELQSAGRLGSINQRHLSFMGSITAPGRLVQQSAPEAAQKLVQDEVDVALLVPV